MKRVIAGAAVILAINVHAQVNFSGTWAEPNLEMIDGIQYSNAMPTKILVTQGKDSIRLERTNAGSNGDVTSTETLPLNGKVMSRVSKTSKRTISSSATWSADKQRLTLLTTYSYADKPVEVEYKNTEVWQLDGTGTLVITKNSDATVTDDWTIKGSYNKQ